MQKQLKLLVLAICIAQNAMAQTTTPSTKEIQAATGAEETQFTFTESQLGEDDNRSQNVTIISSNNVVRDYLEFKFLKYN